MDNGNENDQQSKRIAKLSATVEGLRRALEALRVWNNRLRTAEYTSAWAERVFFQLADEVIEIVMPALSAPGVEAVRQEWDALRQRAETAEAELARLRARYREYMEGVAKQLSEYRDEIARLREDKARLDHLETELEREQSAIDAGLPIPPSLFRQNQPITRKRIDAARQEAPHA